MTEKQSNQVTLITGASKGIGWACAELLAERGHHVVGLARNKPSDFPGDFFSIDLADRKGLDKLLVSLCQQYQFTGLLNNAGIVGPELIEDIDLETVDAVFQINLGAAMQCTKHCVASMKREGLGRIVNISSELALGLPTRTAYGGSKAALISMTRTWALELARDSITVNAIAPGPVDTEFFRGNNPQGSSERIRKLNRIPLGRFASANDIARSVGFFMGPDSEYITGQTLFVDGGSSLASSALF
ncbi:MAG: 3-oxoacyl-[acyl-carrier protein] reductase [Gammaproteobacteria bacterium]|jgi:3-oxoacyl-[acyl-carrier protein] reductase